MNFAGYALDLSDDARKGLAALPAEVQEETLDLLDELTRDPGRLVSRHPPHPDAVVVQ